MGPIEMRRVSKLFRIPHEKRTTLFSVVGGLLLGKHQTFEDFWALRDISLAVGEGEVLGVVGRNGSGKSTLLRIIGNIYQPTSGTVSVRGRIIPFIELGVGFQDELSGRENVYLYGSILGLPKRVIDANYKAIVEFAELKDFMDLPLKDYSSGMNLRLAFATATIAEPDVILIDEVLAVGDAEFQKKCLDKMEDFKRRSRAIVFVSHDAAQVKRLCSRAVLLSHGREHACGEPSEVLAGYARLASKEEKGTRATR